jgi:hypothetical protein
LIISVLESSLLPVIPVIPVGPIIPGDSVVPDGSAVPVGPVNPIVSLILKNYCLEYFGI